MTRNIKALSLAFGVVAALGIMAVSAAQASELHATWQGLAAVTGQQTEQHQITTSAGTVSCTTATFEGGVEGQGSQITAQEFTLTPTYGGCTAFGLAAQVKMNGCKYTLTNQSGTEGNHTTPRTAWVDITSCTAGKSMEVNAGFGGCIATFPQQHHLSHAVFTNTSHPVPHDVNVEVTILGMTYELHGGLCGHPTTALTHNGTYAGKTTLRAYVGVGFEQVTQHGVQFTRVKHNGLQVGLIAT
jgi:hypothetical protein